MTQARSRQSKKSIPIQFQAGDRVFLAGASGTGKTTFGLELVRNLWRHYRVPTLFINSKPDAGIEAIGKRTRSLVTSDDPPKPITRWGLQIWQPTINDIDAYDRYFELILRNRVPAIVFVDEVTSLGKNRGSDYPTNFMRALKQVRGLKITMIVGAQRIAYIPADVLAQATHVVSFNLRNKHDRDTIGREMMLDEYKIEHQHGFYYARIDRIEEPRYYESYQSFFR